MNSTIDIFSYKIFFGPIHRTLKHYLENKIYSRICFIVDHNTKLHCLPLVSDLLDKSIVITIDSGEKHKILSTCEHIWSSMAEAQVDRHSLLINLGGGVIGDMGGFAASCYMRGIDFIQIPTTLLSQVDASVGGKLAIDFKGLKNFIGLFNNPSAVLIDPEFLKTLSDSELRSGFSEMLKHGLIWNSTIWHHLSQEKEWREMNWADEIYKSILIKAEVVKLDPKESGLRKILNFGHTIGHAVESLALNSTRPLLHGEAIALGMIVETTLSARKCGLDQTDAIGVIATFKELFADIDSAILNRHDELINLMRSDKKNKKGNIQFSLLKNIGECTYDISLSEAEIEKGLRESERILNES